MDISEYSKRKASGLVELVKIGSAFAVVQKKFDPNTGIELSPEIQALEIKSLQDQRAILQTQMDQVDALIADMTALAVPK